MNFPGQPKVEEITWDSEYGGKFPARVYSTELNGAKYSITVVDYTNAEAIHAARKKTEAETSMYWWIDIQASIQYAASKLFRMRPGAKVTYDAFHYIDLVSGQQLQVTNADQSRTFAGIYLHDNRLYILDATVPPRAPTPGLFQQSLGFLDEAGNHVRYRELYFNKIPPSKLGGR